MSASAHPAPSAQSRERAEWPSPGTAPRLTVAICTRNRAALLEGAARSVLRQLRTPTELLIVDNASTDGTPEVAARLAAEAPSVVWCREGVLGLSTARNTALHRARGEFVVFLDDDAVAEPGWLEAYERFLSTPVSDNVAVAGGAITPAFEAAPPAWYNVRASTLDLGDAPRRISARTGPWGANLAYRRTLALRAGGFDPELGRRGKFQGLHEEAELNRRLELAGYEIWWLPDARVRHLVTTERCQLRWLLHSEFCGGRSSARLGLQSRLRPATRWAWSSMRVLVTPLHCAYSLILAAAAACLTRQRAAVRNLARTARNLGFGWQLIHEAVGARSRARGRADPLRKLSAMDDRRSLLQR